MLWRRRSRCDVVAVVISGSSTIAQSLARHSAVRNGFRAYSACMSVNVPPSGTRGTRFPRFLARLGNWFMVRRFRSRGARTQGGVATLLLETVGARSGERRQAVLGYLPEGTGSWLVIAAMAGAARHPSWLYNLEQQPDAAIQFDDGRRVDVRAETLHGEDLAAAWDRIGTDAPEFVKYRSQTDRDIPVVRLRARSAEG